MPIYEYSCQACGQSFERLVRLSTPTESIECPQCGQRQAKRMLSAFATCGGDGGSLSFGAGASSGCGGASSGCGSSGFS